MVVLDAQQDSRRRPLPRPREHAQPLRLPALFSELQ